MKIQILTRHEPKSDWYEIYADRELIYEGELTVTNLLNSLMTWLANKDGVEIELRKITIEYNGDDSEDYRPPLHAITAESYWSDWENATRRDSIL